MSKYLISKCSKVIKKIKQTRERTKCCRQIVTEDQQASRYLTAPPKLLRKDKNQNKSQNKNTPHDQMVCVLAKIWKH